MPNWKKLIVSGSSAHLYNLNVASAVTASYFVGDGSGLTNVTTTVAELASITDNFTSATSKVVTHNFNSKNVIVVAYSGDFQIIPSSIETTSNNTVTVTFDTPTTGHIVVSKGGHLLDGTITAGTLGGYSGSYYLDYNNHTNIPQGIVSSSRQLDTQISGSFNLVSASLASRISNISTDFADIQNKPTLLSSSRQIASEISGSFSIVSASLASRISNISTDFADIQNKPTLLSSSRQIGSEISGSFTLVSASFASTIGNLDSIYTTDSQLNTVSGSFATTISNLDNIYATDTQLNIVSESFASTIGNLGNIYATDSELNIVSGAFATTITNLSTSNVVEGTNLYYRDDRVKSKLNSEGVVSGSSQINVKNVQYYSTLATTGSNTFNGNQNITGDVDINGKLTATSFGYIFVSSSTIYTSGSTKFGDTFDDKHQFTGSVEVDGGMNVRYGVNANFFHGDVDFVHLVNTPRFVSSSKQIGSEISGSFTRVSASLASTISNLDYIYATDAQLTAVSSSVATDIAYINNNFAFASSVTSISQSFAHTVNNLQYTYETINNVAQVSSSLASRIDGISTDFYDITNKPTLLSGSAQIASEISGSFTAVSASFANTISNLGSIYATDTELSNVSASFATFVSNLDSTYATDLQLTNVSASFATVISNLDNIYATDLQLTNVSASFATALSNLDSNYATDLQLSDVSASLATSISNISTDWPDITNKPSNIISSSVQLYNSTLTGMIISGSFSGSYVGDGSGLTGVQTTVVQNATVTDNFTAATSKVITHNFGTKNVIVSVYDSNDAVIIPKSIITTDTNTVTLGFDYATTGRVVVAKGGHIVSGSQLVDIVEVATQADSFTAQTTYTATHNFGTKNVFVTVYDDNDNVIIPSIINTPTSSSVQLTFAESTTGRVVIGKAGHVITPESVNLTLFPYTGNASITGSLGITGQTEFGGNLVPKTPQGATLGTAERPFREIYLQSGSINIESDTPGAPSTRLSNVDGNILISAGGMQLVGAASFRAATGSFDYISGSMTQIGNYNQTGDYSMVGSKTINGTLNLNGSLYKNGNKQFNYGQWASLQTQSGSANTAYAMKLEVPTSDTSGLYVGNNASGFPTRIYAQHTGLYNIQFSTQLHTTANQAVDFSIWFAMTGSAIANSNTDFTIEKINGGGFQVGALNFLTPITSGSYVELYYSKTTAQGQLQYKGTQVSPARPATPSVIVTVTQIA